MSLPSAFSLTQCRPVLWFLNTFLLFPVGVTCSPLPKKKDTSYCFVTVFLLILASSTKASILKKLRQLTPSLCTPWKQMEWRYNSSIHYMRVGRQLHALTVLPTSKGKSSPAPTEQTVVWATQSLWALWKLDLQRSTVFAFVVFGDYVTEKLTLIHVFL